MGNSSARSHRRLLRPRRRRGAAAVEFALVAPVLFAVVMATVEFGRAMLVQQVLTNASRVGAREASLPNATLASVQAAVTDYADKSGIDGLTISATPSPATASTGESVTVVVSIGFDEVTWLPGAWFIGDTDLSATSVMRKEGFE